MLQSRVRAQMPNVRMVCGDTMNYWITGHRENLTKVLTGLDGLLINDGEAKLLADNTNLVLAARRILAMGPKTLIVKHGEYGATAFFGPNAFPGSDAHSVTLPFRAPALPLEEVVDPTGAGDSFAGGFFRIPCVAAKGHSTGIQKRHVLRRRDGFVRRAEVWHRANAGAHA